jgi:membrane fusion protein, multidrug efflux system
VPERFAGQAAEGQPVEVRVEAYPNEVFAAQITRISPAIDPASRTFEIEAIVPNADHRLSHGAFAKAHIVTRSDAEAVTAPLESIVSFAGVTKLFVVAEGQAQSIPVTIGSRGDGWVEVLGPVSPGMVVVTSGQTQLAEGTAVAERQPLAGAHVRTAARSTSH